MTEKWFDGGNGMVVREVGHAYQMADAAYLNALEADKAALLEALEILPGRMDEMVSAEAAVGIPVESTLAGVVHLAKQFRERALSRFRPEGAEVKAGE